MRKVAKKSERRKLSSPRTRFGGVTIVVKQQENPKREKTAAFKQWGQMTKYVKSHRGATAADVFAHTEYGPANLRYDQEHGYIATKKKA